MAQSDHNETWLIADIGATSSRCGVYCPPTGETSAIRVYRNEQAGSLPGLLADYLANTGSKPGNCALAVAAPVAGNEVRMINRDWRFSRTELSRQFGFGRLELMNDFHAIAYALPTFGDSDRVELGQASEYRRGNIAVLGPGSGLGMSAWIRSDMGGATMTGEGGHISLSGRDQYEDTVIAGFRDRYGHCSAERVLSGPGLIALHSVMHDIDLRTSEEITERTDDPTCAATLNQFFLFLGAAAADLALITGCNGGLYIAGGIVPACIDQIQASDFRARFEDKNRYRNYMRAIPTWVITDPLPGLTGLAAYIDQGS